ncbi:hypothetical protein J27TS8_04640 [Robertmurraya siralis]|uniref:Uncharacterized protein n=1 Tax=Robertmurraya siralis TaxID=77777 RepID=A0A920BSA0_9BACI|nr:hypothetical protein [Robertmurraya siralis]PAE21811.1 hypothetical protein CHH80_03725 [Bacillus sp. 7504-2]GIN60471.1 hypothetical protein J27TS8_04640 [Robertmurraya siralis]
MGRLVSLLLIGIGGYWVFQNRFRLANFLLGNSMMRRVLVSSFMRIPLVRNQMFSSLFSGGAQKQYGNS